MQGLFLLGILISLLEADTQFIRSNIQSRIFGYYQFLSGLRGRNIFYAIIAFMSFSRLEIFSALALIAGVILTFFTLIRLILFDKSNDMLNELGNLVHDEASARDKFKSIDTDNDGYLQKTDMAKLFEFSDTKSCGPCKRWLDEILFWRLDEHTNDGKIDTYEFVQYCISLKRQIELEKIKIEDRLAHSNDNNK